MPRMRCEVKLSDPTRTPDPLLTMQSRGGRLRGGLSRFPSGFGPDPPRSGTSADPRSSPADSPGSRWAAPYSSIDSPGCALDMVCLRFSPDQTSAITVTESSRISTGPCCHLSVTVRAVCDETAAQGAICANWRGARGRTARKSSLAQAVPARCPPTAKAPFDRLALAGQLEDRVGHVGGPHEHLEVSAAEVAVSPSLVPGASAGRRVEGLSSR